MFIQPIINAQSRANVGIPFLILPMYAPLLLTISKGVTNVLKFTLFFQMSWISQGHTNLPHNMSLNMLFFRVFVNLLFVLLLTILAIARTYKASAQYVTKLPFFEVFVNYLSWRFPGHFILV